VAEIWAYWRRVNARDGGIDRKPEVERVKESPTNTYQLRKLRVELLH
jgi:hypothetical protein